jgi:uncharacterized protein YukE
MTITDAENDAAESAALLDTIKGSTWVAGGLRAGGGLGALDTPMRSIERLPAEGLGWVVPHVLELQLAVDRLGGNASVIRSFADAWQRAGGRVGQVQEDLAGSVRAATAQWHGVAADGYRERAAEITADLRGVAVLSEGMGAVALAMGEVVADARTKAGELLDDLVGRLVSQTRQAIEIEQGVTPDVVAQATELISTYRTPIAEIEANVRQTIDNVEKLLTGDGSVQVAVLPALIALAVGRVLLRLLIRHLIRLERRRRQEERRRLGDPEEIWRRRELQDRELDQELRKKLEEAHTRKNYRGDEYAEGMAKVYGPPPDDGKVYVGHHNFPVKFGPKFEKHGIDTTNPAWGSWVEEKQHQRFGTQFNKDWQTFFDNNPDATREDIFKFVRQLAKTHNYTVSF